MKSINSIKKSLRSHPTRPVEETEKDLAMLGEQVMQSNTAAALAKAEEVFRNSNKNTQASTFHVPQSQSSSSQHQPVQPTRSNLASRFSKIFSKGKANSQSDAPASQAAGPRASKDASLTAAPNRSEPSSLAFPARAHTPV